MAERHVEEGIRHVEQQQALVATLARDGHEVTAPRALLTQFQELLRLHVAIGCAPSPRKPSESPNRAQNGLL